MHADIWHVVMGRPYVLRLMGGGFRKPKQPILGTDIAGVVEAVGAKITRFKPRDTVFGETVNGFQWKNGGVLADSAEPPEEVKVSRAQEALKRAEKRLKTNRARLAG